MNEPIGSSPSIQSVVCFWRLTCYLTVGVLPMNSTEDWKDATSCRRKRETHRNDVRVVLQTGDSPLVVPVPRLGHVLNVFVRPRNETFDNDTKDYLYFKRL